ncbi:DUF2268 domain-containing putative Zn-dependent protease [Chryseobacterium contaminans]|uniref:DUF2268 domain-containing putative Zn-dependent protease n=1 Tax=Chryseobacterium contaminans TaxID=1423959 RepID=UPI00301627C5
MKKIIPVLSVFVVLSCSTRNPSANTDKNFDYDRLEKVADSVKVENIVINNLFKHQLLAHKNQQYDSARIVKNVYWPHKKLWDSCYGVIFGDENAYLFNNSKGMIAWNKSLYEKNRQEFESKANIILSMDLKKHFQKTLTQFNRLVPYQPNAKISLIFTPITGISFGGCNAEQFALELNNKDVDILYTLEKTLPHELNHLVYEHFRNMDSNGGSALSQTIDEGFACYFTYVFFNGKLEKHEAVENMSKENWNWYMHHEKEIFTKLKPYFSDRSGNNPLLRNDQHKLFPDAPKSLNYWLGFRIIEKYVEKNGPDSWKKIYYLSAKELLGNSGYENYIEKL